MNRKPIYVDPLTPVSPEALYTGQLPWVTFHTRDPLRTRLKHFFASEASSGFLGLLLAVPVIISAFAVVMIVFFRQLVEHSYGQIVFLLSVPGPLLFAAIVGFERPFTGHHPADESTHQCSPPRLRPLGTKWACPSCGFRWRVTGVVPAVDPKTEPATEPIPVYYDDPITEPIRIITIADLLPSHIVEWLESAEAMQVSNA